MLSLDVWQFSEIQYLYDAYAPLTASGRRAKANKRCYVDREELSRQYDLTDQALGLYQRRHSEMSRVEYHLKHAGDIESISTPEMMGPSEIFIVKQFLLNYRSLVQIIDDEAREAFDLRFRMGELLSKLDVDDSETESFYISDRYRRDLRDLRNELRTVASQCKNALAQLHQELIDTCELDFRYRDFLVVPNSICHTLSRETIFLEPYDNAHMIARPIMSEAYLQLYATSEALAEQERQLEQEVREELSAHIAEWFDDLQAAARRLMQFDVSLARARLCRTFNLVRPTLNNHDAFDARGLRLLPLEESCERKQLRYWPLDVRLETPCCVIRGSNMCGKTIVLKTLGFCQLAAQLGFFVPAESYTTAVYEQISYVGPVTSAMPEGISYFGMEIVTLAKSLQSKAKSKLLLMDEFARTTNSREAISLIGGLLEWMCGQANLRSVMATHYQVIPDLAGLTDLAMKGLKWEQFDAEGFGHDDSANSPTLAERLCRIQECIEYTLIPFSEELPIGDALHVASAIGLDHNIIALAQKHADMAKRKRNRSDD